METNGSASKVPWSWSKEIFKGMANWTDNHRCTSVGHDLICSYRKYLLAYEQARGRGGRAPADRPGSDVSRGRVVFVDDRRSHLEKVQAAIEGSGRPFLGLHYERVADPKLFGCSDANWCTRQSTSGCAFKIGTAIISYFSKKQGHISLSTFEAEISAGTLAACEAVHLRSLLASLGYKPKGPTIIKIDNTAALLSLIHI